MTTYGFEETLSPGLSVVDFARQRDIYPSLSSGIYELHMV
jgi:hypothetical protein